MSKLSFFAHDHEGHDIRVTENREFSVYDVFVAFGICSKKNTTNIFNRLLEEHPEVLTICKNIQIPGQGQRETPVAFEAGIYEILMNCPGERAAEFRRWAAGILADPDKAAKYAIARYRKQGRSDEWIDDRLKVIDGRKKFTDVLQEHGVAGRGYPLCTDEINVQVLGHTAKEIRAIRQVKVTRDGLDEVELAALHLAEAMSGKEIKEQNLHGNDECHKACRSAGQKVSRIFE